MSSLWNRMTGGNDETQTQTPGAAKAPGPTGTDTPATAVKHAYGIAQANELMATLAVGDDAELVVRVIRTTLESVGVQVGDLIADAERREGELRAEIDQRRSTIGELERQVEAQRVAIGGLETELALTSQTRNGLERSQPKGPPMPARPPTPPSASGRDSRDSDRPTVMAVPKGLGEAVLGDADIESLPPDEPAFPPRAPRPPETK